MKLIPAPGGKEIQDALEHHYVHKIVNILLLIVGQSFFKEVASFLRKHDCCTSPSFPKSLHALRLFHLRHPDAEGYVVTPAYVDELVNTLEALYKQDQKLLDVHRGAIVELLTNKLVLSRCPIYECFSNHRFIDGSSRYQSDQIDIAVFSQYKRQIEGYECKMNSGGIQSVHCTNLVALAEKSQELDYSVHVGFICFDHSWIIQQRIKRFSLNGSITAYGLDNLQDLQDNPFDV